MGFENIGGCKKAQNKNFHLSSLFNSLILKSRGLKDGDISQVFDAISSIIPKPLYLAITVECISLAAKLRSRHPELSFFDSLHAAIALIEDLVYYDLDDVIRGVVESEREELIPDPS